MLVVFIIGPLNLVIGSVFFSDVLRRLVNELTPVTAQWRELGREFGFTENELDEIQQSKHYEVRECMTTMLDRKLKRTPGFGWEGVKKALRNIGREDLIHYPQG